MYMAPEQEAGARTLTPAADLYALGCVLFEMLTGQRYKRVRPGTKPSELPRGSPPWLDAVVTKALVEDPWDRFQEAREVTTALQQGALHWAEQKARLAELDRLYEAVQQALESNRLHAALHLCDQIQQLGPGYRDVSELRLRLEKNLKTRREARERDTAHQIQIARLYDEARRALDRQDWSLALERLQRLAREEPGYRDIDHLRYRAEQGEKTQREVEQRERARRAEAERLYAAAQAALKAKQWAVALERCEELVRREHAYRDVIQLREQAEAGLRAEREKKERVQEHTKRLSQAPRHVLAKLRTIVAPPIWQKVGIEMVTIPAGEFLYGEEKLRVYLPEYRLAKTPVTVAQFQAFVQATGHRKPEHYFSSLAGWSGSDPPWWAFDLPSDTMDHPVMYVTWADALAFCRWAARRLPTEQEWEKGARGTDGRQYPWGTAWEFDCCNSEEAYVKKPTPVGRYPKGASPYGLLDMAGNVWEWCEDWYDESRKEKVLRGGSYATDRIAARSAIRHKEDPGKRYESVGFRCCVSAND